MSLWASITNTTARGADLLATAVNNRITHLVPKNAPFIRALLGPVVDAGGTPFDPTNFVTSKTVQGGKGRIVWQGEIPTPAAVTNEVAAATASLNADRRGAATFDLTHYNLMHTISFEELTYAKGNAQYIDDYLGTEIDSALRGFWNKIATDVHATGDQTTSAIGSLARALDSTDDIGTYLGIERADSANVNLRANTAEGSGITAADLEDLISDCIGKGGSPDMIVVSSATFKTLRAEAVNGASYNYNAPGKGAFIGASELHIAGVPVLQDGYCSDTYSYVLDTSTWQFQWDDTGMKVGKPMRHQTYVSAYVMPMDLIVGLACFQPRFNGRFKNLTA